jgi:hypothetical protein
VRHKHGGQPHDSNTHNQTGDSPNNPLHVKLVAGENETTPKSNTPQDDENSKKKPHKWPAWMGTPDWWIAGGTIALAVFAIGSFILLWTQLNDAREALEVDQRPWVLIGPDWPLEKTPFGVMGQRAVVNE